MTSGEFPFRTKDSKFEYHSNDIPSSILSLKDIKGEISLDIIIKISGVQATGVTLKDMRIKLPKGFMVRETRRASTIRQPAYSPLMNARQQG